MRILYVDDHERFRAIVVKEFLARHEVVGASSLAQARAILAPSLFDAVLLDFDLPDGKGVELMPELRSLGLASRVVAVSSHEEGNAQLLAAGAFAVVGKAQFKRIGEVLQRLEENQ